MDNVSSIIDGSIAVAGMIAALVITFGSLIASESAPGASMEGAGDAVSRTLKKKSA